ncbi:MAG: helical backbone metal receptor [Proteobacteria bacterium]|nr:helical backbone metal receptor [Pseudomonadota bacterium]
MRAFLGLCLVVACGVGAACGRAPEPAPAGPRLVSLTPSSTEIVAALDATADLVGVDDYSTYPAEVANLPKVGSFLAPNLETIVGLRPTLVIVDDVHGKAAAALGDVGVQTIACAIHALPDVKAALVAIGARLGRSAQATRVIAGIDAAIATALARRPAKRPRVLVIIDREAGGLGNLVAAGTGSWIDELLAITGGANVLAGAITRYPKISTEEVLTTRPDVILDLSFAGKASLAAWKPVTSARVVALSEPYLVAPSPRVADALAALARALE